MGFTLMQKKESVVNKKALCRLRVAFIVLTILALLPFMFSGLLSVNLQSFAHFGNYLAGTVGVAVLIATLDTLIYTLSQQQELVESQKEMLDEQKRQIKLFEVQNDEIRKSNSIDIAYRNSSVIFPDLVSSFGRSLNRSVSVKEHQKGLVAAFGKLGYSNSFQRGVMVRNPEKLYPVFDMAPCHEIEEFVEDVFENIARLYVFMIRQVEVAPELRDYFEEFLSTGGEMPTDLYFQFYHAYLLGRGNKGLYIKGVDCFGFKGGYCTGDKALSDWNVIGEMLRSGLEKAN